MRDIHMTKRIMKHRRTLLVFGSLLFSSPFVQAEGKEVVYHEVDSQPGYLGVLLGLNSTSEGSVKNSAVVGATIGTRLGPHLGVGIFGSYYGQTHSGPYLGLPADTATSSALLTAQVNYFLDGFHIGGEVGAAFRFWSGAASAFTDGSSTVTLIFGPHVGYDYKISRNLSFGAELHVLFPSQRTEATVLQGFGVVKLWL